MTRPVTRIVVPASWWDESGPVRVFRTEAAIFKLGEGPCGLTVTKLEARLRAGSLMIRQTHAEETQKVFVYPLTQLHGRAEVHHG